MIQLAKTKMVFLKTDAEQENFRSFCLKKYCHGRNFCQSCFSQCILLVIETAQLNNNSYTKLVTVFNTPEKLSNIRVDWQNRYQLVSMSMQFRRWIPNPGIPGSKPLGSSKVNSAFHPFDVDQLSNRNSWELNVRK